MKRTPWLVLVLSLAAPLPGRGETRYTFKPAIKQGDVITHDAVTKMTLEMASGGKPLLEVKRSENTGFTETIDRLGPDGKVLQMTEATTRNEQTNETLVQGKPIQAPDEEGTLAGVTMRLERQEGGRYKRTLVEGKSSKKVEDKLKKGDRFVMGEDLLPTRPLAVGESETITDPERIKELSEDFGEDSKLEKPPVITLEEVKTVDGRKTAILHEVVTLNGSLPGPGGKPIPMKLNFDIKTTYDLDRNFITGFDTTVNGTGTVEQNNTAIDLKLTSDLKDKIGKR
jgi:hypothetical protein